LGQKKSGALFEMSLGTMRIASGILAGALLLGASTCSAQIFHKKKKVNKSTAADNNAQPDKILYDKAMEDIKHGRQEVGRLGMQTLINTYPDSEYLAKAKLAIADSYYKEGGTGNLTLAISAYKDFGVFFPFLPEATYAQLQVAMAHFRQMEKPDRDRTEALAAEDEFQIFLQKYPNDPHAPEAQQHLREVQEILAEGDYRIGYFYYVKGDKRAAATRLITVASRYPLYSKSDRVLWMMGDIFEKSERKDIADNYYARIVRNYPLSSLVPEAKDKLKSDKLPVPQPDPTAVAWMTAEQNAPRPKPKLVMKPLALIHSGPGAELVAAARTGTPQMEPESDAMSLGELLKPAGATGSGGKTALVATVPVGSSSTPAESVGDSGGSGATTDSGGAAPATGEAQPAPAAATPAAGNAAPNTAPPAANAAETPAKPDAAAPATADGAAATTPADAAKPEDANKPADAQANSDAKSNDKDKKESSSKKKKGLKKLVPW
jgi:outer membrane protein assembly factor BamD